MRGGYRNGAGRPAWRTRADSLLHIDVRVWARKGLLIPGHEEFGWNPWTQSDSTMALLKVRIDDDATHAVLSCKPCSALPQSLDTPISIPLDRTRCNFGGQRVWFLCPAIGCGRRVALLYLKAGSIVCRHCGHLGYGSQSLTRRDKALAQAAKIRSKLGGCEAIAFEFPDKPPGMRRRTYAALKKKCKRHEAIAFSCLALAVRQMKFG